MLILEALLFTTLLYTGIYVTITDIKRGIIQNKRLLQAAVPGALINILYYSIYAREYFLMFLLNFLILGIISILFYAYRIWAAGDSKLLILMIFLMPARIYNMNGVAPAVWVLICTFSVAYIYVIVESIYLGIRRKTLFEIKLIKIDIISFFKQYVCCSAYILLLNQLCVTFFSDFAMENSSLIVMGDLILILSVSSIKRLRNKWTVLAIIATDIIFYVINKIDLGIIDLKMLVVTAMVILLRVVAEKYNYMTISTVDVRQGMVLSYATVVDFAKSKVKGLPQTTTEDIRSRISQEEAESILRWRTSKYGREQISIVRKIPFAIFIFIGTIAFIVIGMCL